MAFVQERYRVKDRINGLIVSAVEGKQTESRTLMCAIAQFMAPSREELHVSTEELGKEELQKEEKSHTNGEE